MIRFSSWENLSQTTVNKEWKFLDLWDCLPTQSPSLSIHKGNQGLQKLKHKTYTKKLRRIRRSCWTWWNDKRHRALTPQLGCSHRASWHTPWRYRKPPARLLSTPRGFSTGLWRRATWMLWVPWTLLPSCAPIASRRAILHRESRSITVTQLLTLPRNPSASWPKCRVWRTVKRESENHSVVSLFVTPWTIEFMEISRPEYWSGQPFPSPGDLPNPGMNPGLPKGECKWEGLGFPAKSQGKFLLQCLGKISWSTPTTPMARRRKNMTSDSPWSQERAAQGVPATGWLLKYLLQVQEDRNDPRVTQVCSKYWQGTLVALLPPSACGPKGITHCSFRSQITGTMWMEITLSGNCSTRKMTFYFVVFSWKRFCSFR